MTATTDNQSFPQPVDATTSLWRYMGLAKLLSLLTARSLYFSRMDFLGDGFEGSTTSATVALRDGKPESNDELFARFRKNACQYAFANCWHLSQHESAAMWRLYSSIGGGIAVRTTYDCLRESLPESCKLGLISYVDYSTHVLREGDLYEPYMHKRLSFAHEQEVRALILDIPTDGVHHILPEHHRVGIQVSIDPGQLIHAIFVTPAAPQWYLDVVTDAVGRYGWSIPVVRSAMDDSPVY